jgi:hypothetical protein
MVMVSLNDGSSSRSRARQGGQCQLDLNLTLHAECERSRKGKQKRESSKGKGSACSSSYTSRCRIASAPRLLLLLVLLSNIMWLPTTTAQFANCFTFISQVDADENRILSQAEFAALVRLMTSGAIDEPVFSALPSAVSALYVVPFGAPGGGIDISGIDDTAASSATVESFCTPFTLSWRMLWGYHHGTTVFHCHDHW